MTDSNDGKVICQVYSRVVGYIRPTSLWNKAKQKEFEERRVYDVAEFRNRREEEREPVSTPA